MRAKTILLVPVAGMLLAIIGGVLGAHTASIVVPHSYAGETSITVLAPEETPAVLTPVGSTPAVSITYPVTATAYWSDWTGMITGTASPETGRTITSVSVAIEDATTQQWWSGSSFNDDSQTFVQATGTITWMLPIAAASFTSGDSYSVIAQAADSAGETGITSTVSITYNDNVL